MPTVNYLVCANYKYIYVKSNYHNYILVLIGKLCVIIMFVIK